MKVTFIGHASILVEADGVSVLSDPWWGKSCFGAQWWHCPSPATSRVYERPPDYIYISHGHHDHFHPGTLKTLPRSAKVIVSSELNLAKGIRRLGFDTIELKPENPEALSRNLKAWIWPTHGGDSLLVLWDAEQSCINLNDALHAAPRPVQEHNISLLKERFPKRTYAFCGYGTASHFPNCFRIPGKDDRATAARRQSYFNAQWSYIMSQLQPEFAIPFAASVVILQKELIGLNETVHNTERPTERFRSTYGETGIRLVDPAPGFSIDGGRIVDDVRFEPLRIEDVVVSHPEAVAHANACTDPSDAQVTVIADLLRSNIEACRDQLLEHRSGYHFLIRFPGSDKGISVVRNRAGINVEPLVTAGGSGRDYDVCFTARPEYLRNSLTREFGSEILFVGSGGIFEYRERSAARTNLHRQLATMLVRHSRQPDSRYRDDEKWSFRIKRLARSILGVDRKVLYDLDRWIVYTETSDSVE